MLPNFENVPNIHFWCQRVLPTVFDESLSYLEKVCKLEMVINELITDYNKFGKDVTNEINSFESSTTAQIEEFINQTNNIIETFKNEVTAEITKFKNDVNASNQAFQTQITNLQKSFEESMTNSFNQFKASITKAQEDFEDRLLQQQTTFETGINQTVNNMQTVVNNIPHTIDQTVTNKLPAIESNIIQNVDLSGIQSVPTGFNVNAERRGNHIWSIDNVNVTGTLPTNLTYKSFNGAVLIETDRATATDQYLFLRGKYFYRTLNGSAGNRTDISAWVENSFYTGTSYNANEITESGIYATQQESLGWTNMPDGFLDEGMLIVNNVNNAIYQTAIDATNGTIYTRYSTQLSPTITWSPWSQIGGGKASEEYTVITNENIDNLTNGKYYHRNGQLTGTLPLPLQNGGTENQSLFIEVNDYCQKITNYKGFGEIVRKRTSKTSRYQFWGYSSPHTENAYAGLNTPENLDHYYSINAKVRPEFYENWVSWLNRYLSKTLTKESIAGIIIEIIPTKGTDDDDGIFECLQKVTIFPTKPPGMDVAGTLNILCRNLKMNNKAGTIQKEFTTWYKL